MKPPNPQGANYCGIHYVQITKKRRQHSEDFVIDEVGVKLRGLGSSIACLIDDSSTPLHRSLSGFSRSRAGKRKFTGFSLKHVQISDPASSVGVPTSRMHYGRHFT